MATGDEDGPGAVAREAFGLLGHDLRLDILLALLDRWRAAHTEPQRYSELMRAVGERDSGKFNYHLDKLRGTYVRQVDSGYVPMASATALYRSVLAYRPTTESRVTTFPVGVTCPDCGADLRAAYEQQFLTVSCPDCAETVEGFTYPFPKNGLENRGDETVVRATYERARHHVNLARTGQCPFCAGTTTVTVDRDTLAGTATDDTATGSAFDAHERPVEITCDTCTFVVTVGFLFALSMQRRVATALGMLGVGTDDVWEQPSTTTRVAADEPLTVEIELASGGRTASVVTDGDLDVHSVTVDGDPVGDG